MTITITKYVRLTGGCRRAHSPIVLANLSRPQMIELIAYLKIQSFHAFISEDEVRLVIYKVIQEKAGLFGLKKENVIVECQVEEVLPHIEACLPCEEIVVQEPLGYLSDD